MILGVFLNLSGSVVISNSSAHALTSGEMEESSSFSPVLVPVGLFNRGIFFLYHTLLLDLAVGFWTTTPHFLPGHGAGSRFL